MLLLVALARADDAPCVATTPAALADRLRDTLAGGDYGQVTRLVHEAEAAWPCLRAYTTAEDLSQVYQLAGTAAWYGPHREDAAPLFRRAATVAPTVPFDVANLGAEAERAWRTAGDEVAAGPMVRLVALGAVVVDGTALRPGSTVVLPAGTHLLQEGDDGGVRTRVVDLATDELVRVGTPDPALVATRTALLRRKRATAWGSAGALAVVSGGLYALAATQEASLHELDPESVSDPEARARTAQWATHLAVSGAAVSLVGAVGLTVRGATVRVDLYPGIPATDAAALPSPVAFGDPP